MLCLKHQKTLTTAAAGGYFQTRSPLICQSCWSGDICEENMAVRYQLVLAPHVSHANQKNKQIKVLLLMPVSSTYWAKQQLIRWNADVPRWIKVVGVVYTYSRSSEGTLENVCGSISSRWLKCRYLRVKTGGWTEAAIVQCKHIPAIGKESKSVPCVFWIKVFRWIK